MKNKQPLVAGLAVAVALALAGTVLLRGALSPAPAADGANVTVVDGTQIVTIRAKAGYSPETSAVRAGLPTVLRFETGNTFDCSLAVTVPSLGIDRTLPMTGTTDIAVGTLQPGTLRGSCSMGMYDFALVAN